MEFEILESLFRFSIALQNGKSLEKTLGFFIESLDETKSVKSFYHRASELWRDLPQNRPLRFHQVFLEKVDAGEAWKTLHPMIFLGEATNSLSEMLKLGCTAVLLQQKLKTEKPDEKDLNLLSVLLHWFPPEEPTSPNFPRWSGSPLWKIVNSQPGKNERAFIDDWIQTESDHKLAPISEDYKLFLGDRAERSSVALASQFKTLCVGSGLRTYSTLSSVQRRS